MTFDYRDPAFWQGRYESGKFIDSAQTGWDLEQPAPPIRSYLAGRGASLAKGRALVVGCGRGHEAVLFAQNGWDVVGIDFAPAAIRFATEQADALGVAATFLQRDLFTIRHEFAQAFDAVIEHTCFCAIDPARREEYVKTVAAVTKPGGVYIALFFAVLPPDGPPFPTSVEEVLSCFGPYFEEETLFVPDDSVPSRAGEELFGVFRRK
ncbi:MAG: methyltransferase domain-containing protein [Candidatus Poribacteria bacterium]|nr:methyltransferase domain-containing protein [Candidatus Poribacteria bacterium]